MKKRSSWDHFVIRTKDRPFKDEIETIIGDEIAEIREYYSKKCGEMIGMNCVTRKFQDELDDLGRQYFVYGMGYIKSIPPYMSFPESKDTCIGVLLGCFQAHINVLIEQRVIIDVINGVEKELTRKEFLKRNPELRKRIKKITKQG